LFVSGFSIEQVDPRGETCRPFPPGLALPDLSGSVRPARSVGGGFRPPRTRARQSDTRLGPARNLRGRRQTVGSSGGAMRSARRSRRSARHSESAAIRGSVPEGRASRARGARSAGACCGPATSTRGGGCPPPRATNPGAGQAPKRGRTFLPKKSKYPVQSEPNWLTWTSS